MTCLLTERETKILTLIYKNPTNPAPLLLFQSHWLLVSQPLGAANLYLLFLKYSQADELWHLLLPMPGTLECQHGCLYLF
jgi:hypothetical protein